MKFALKAAVAVLALCAAMPASAALVILPGNECDASRTNPDAVACAGYYEGNLLGGSPTDLTDQAAALDALLGGGNSYTGTINWADVEDTKAFFDLIGGVLEFDTTLFGSQILGIHFGGAGEFDHSVTVFYLFDFGDAGADSITLNQQGFSDGVLYDPPPSVPEPATWALMLVGFGAAGFAMRRRRKLPLSQVA